MRRGRARGNQRAPGTSIWLATFVCIAPRALPGAGGLITGCCRQRSQPSKLILRARDGCGDHGSGGTYHVRIRVALPPRVVVRVMYPDELAM
jgi:hypothetical protein